MEYALPGRRDPIFGIFENVKKFCRNFFDHWMGFDDFFQSHFLSPKMPQNMFLSPESDSPRFKRLSLTFWVIFDDFEFFRYIRDEIISPRNMGMRLTSALIYILYGICPPRSERPDFWDF